MTTYAVAVWRSREEADDDLSFAVIAINPFHATWLLKYKAIVDQLKADNHNISHLALTDVTPEWISYKVPEDLFTDPDGSEIAMGIHQYVDDEGYCEIAEVNLQDSPENDELDYRMRCSTLHVSDHGVTWEAQDKYRDYTVNTHELPWSVIEAAAHATIP